MASEVEYVSGGIGDEADLETGCSKRLEYGLHVLVDLEVLMVDPAARQLERHVLRHGARAAHADDDALRERDPDLLVVVELRMALQLEESRSARRFVAGHLEREAVALAAAHVALGHQLRA